LQQQHAENRHRQIDREPQRAVSGAARDSS
jgi:hypothetical protein